jgi:hypothetical protein
MSTSVDGKNRLASKEGEIEKENEKEKENENENENDSDSQSFLCRAVETQWKSTKMKRYRCRFSLRVPSKRVVRIQVECPTDDRTTDCKAVAAFARDAIRVVYALALSRPPRRMVLKITLLGARKIWCGESVLTPCHVNSGWTEFGRGFGITRVQIYRREDWSKVLLHELLHACDWDRLAPGGVPANAPANSRLPNEPASEAIVEAVAVWLHSNMLATDRTDLAGIWRAEQAHTRKLAAHVLSRTFTATTNVRSYYLLKAGLMGTPEGWNATVAWLQTPNPAQGWAAHVYAAMERTKQIPPIAFDGCVLMNMAEHQLSTSAKRLEQTATKTK